MDRSVLLSGQSHERRLSCDWVVATKNRFFSLALSIYVGFLAAAPTDAADKTDETDYPLAVINAASIQQLREKGVAVFEAADRPDMADRMDQWIVEEMREAKGIDRSRPFGTMLYLSPLVLAPPVGVSYLPVSNLEETLETLANGTGQVIPVEGDKTRYDIQYDQRKIRTLYRGGYLFLVEGNDDDDSSLDKNFPDPEKLTSRLSAQYDISVSLMLNSLPVGLKTGFLAYFDSHARGLLQQRDNEPESPYRLRRANGEFWIELVDRIVNQGQDITFGVRIDNTKKVGSIELEIAGTRDSKLAKFFQGMVGKRTYFGNLLDYPSTFTMSVSYLFEEAQRKLFIKYFEAALSDLEKNAKNTDSEPLVKIIDPIFKTLMTTADIGHLDAIVQLTGSVRGEFGLVGGAKLVTSRGLPTQLENGLQFLIDNPNGSDRLSKLELSFDTIDSHPVHRLPMDPSAEFGQRMFGTTAYLYLYANPNAVWVAYGGDAALESLKNAVQTVSLPQDVQQTRNRVPFQFVTHATKLLSAGDEEDAGFATFNEQAQAAFESDNDAIKLEIRPTDSGVRLRIEFESGFITLLGRGLSKGIETGMFNRPQRDRQARERREDEPAPENKRQK